MKEYEIKNQWGTLTRGFFSYSDQEKYILISQVKTIIDDIKKNLNIDCIISYGALLGSIRNTKLIDHDFDIDICFIVPNNTVESIYDYVFKLIEYLNDKKYNIYFFSNGQFAIIFDVTSLISVKIEFFVSWFEQDRYYQNFAISGQIDKKDIYPTKYSILENVLLPCPNNYEKVLSTIYGIDWKIPNKNFKYDFRNKIDKKPFLFLENHHKVNYWNTYYKQKEKNKVWITEPSSFAKFVNSSLNKKIKILDIGCGNCRDSLFFRLNNHFVSILDGSKESINYCDIKYINKYELNIENTYAVINFIKNNKEKYDGIYSRFFLHSISEIGQLNFLNLCKHLLTDNGNIYIEKRTTNITKKYFYKNTDLHYRRIQDDSSLIKQAFTFGFEKKYHEISDKFSILDNEKPIISRIFFTKNLRNQLDNPTPVM